MSNIKIEYAASSALTITLAGLPSDTNLLAGRESTALDNTTNKYLDYLVAGKITTGTTPTDFRQIEVWAVGLMEDTTWPDVFDGTDSAETLTSLDIKNSILRLVAVMATNNTSDRTYWFGPVSLQAIFGTIPKKVVFFVVHNTAVNLNNTGGNQAIWVTPVYATVT